MTSFSSDFVRPLYLAENHFLQVLLSQFALIRRAAGAELQVHFNNQTPAIWLREAKLHVSEQISDPAKVQRYQAALDAILIRGTGKRYDFDDPTFPFRYASGGTLPIIRMGNREYYCLFYRDIPPVGWNIANGGCDSREELLNPFDAVDRELREELVVVDPKNRRRYVFADDAGKPVDHPDFAVARRIWQARFRELNFPDLQEWQIPLKWLDGPDTLIVHYGEEQPARLEGCFLNINAEDFGIEVDRVAKMNIDEDAILCDGELIEARLVNRLVGLFEVHRFNRVLAADATAFLPEQVFYNAERFDGSRLEELVARCLRDLQAVRSRREIEPFEATENKCDLCPVTRRIVKRYLSMEPYHGDPERPRPDSSCDIFISFASEDRGLARQVYDHLLSATRKRLFFSDEMLHHSYFGREIDDALDAASHLIAVGSSVEHLTKLWVDYEWRSFHHDILSGRKRNGALVACVSGCDPDDLPRPLRFRNAVKLDPGQPGAALRQLEAFVQ